MSDNNHKLLILADDLTGALDSGVQLSRKGIQAIILTNINLNHIFDHDETVIVINTNTRHMKPADAYQIIYKLVKEAIANHFDRIYKKTDSGLRGNVGAELTAVLEASGQTHLNFIPAYPIMNRTTVNGIQYIENIPVAESIFAKDPIDPVKVSSVAEIIHLQSKVPVNPPGGKPEGIIVYDAASDTDMRNIAKQLKDDLTLTAGCAGFLEVYPFNKTDQTIIEKPELPDKLLVVSGSVNQVTIDQLQYAEAHGAKRFHVPENMLLCEEADPAAIEAISQEILEQSTDIPILIVDSLAAGPKAQAADAQTIAKNMGLFAQTLTQKAKNRLLMFIGGDTLLGYIQSISIQTMKPLAEIFPGIVLATTGKGDYLITKSGGFGNTDLLIEIEKLLKEKEEKI